MTNTITFNNRTYRIGDCWIESEVPSTIEFGNRTLIPVRKFYADNKNIIILNLRYYYFDCEGIKDLCRYMGIPIIRPFGIKNIPCIDSVFVPVIIKIYEFLGLNNSDYMSYRNVDERDQCKTDIKNYLEEIGFSDLIYETRSELVYPLRQS
jgi:hypothetical protein